MFDFFRDQVDIVKELSIGPPKRPKPPQHRRSKTWESKSPRRGGKQSQGASLTDAMPPNAAVGGSFSHPKKDREAFRSSLVNIIM